MRISARDGPAEAVQAMARRPTPMRPDPPIAKANAFNAARRALRLHAEVEWKAFIESKEKSDGVVDCNAISIDRKLFKCLAFVLLWRMFFLPRGKFEKLLVAL